MIRRVLPVLICSVAVVSCGRAAGPPAPYGAVPTERQLRWHEMEYYGFIHFAINTYTDQEWGYGDEPISLFNPEQLDAGQWAKIARDAGMKGLIITAKHHVGFCLWPSGGTEFSVKHAPWKQGKGDIVGELAQSCREYGLKFGVYLSPWDRNHAEYGRPAYLEYYRSQLRELCTRYGPLFEVWFDGANGGTGYYGGARENRRIDPGTYYDWATTWAIVRELQPGACIFSDVGPDSRWVGNESGHAGNPCWATYTPAAREGASGLAPGTPKYQEGYHGHRDGKYWMPAEVDVSVRPGWFYHAKQDDQVKSVEQLLEIYYNSVGLGANLLLNIPPDRRGLVHENDVKNLTALGRVLALTFDEDLAQGKKASADEVRGDSEQFAASNVTDGDRDTYWAADDGVTQGQITIDLGKPTLFNRVRVQEYIQLGQRVDAFEVDAHVDDGWQTIAEGTCIGPRRILRTEAVLADQVRLRITKAAACPTVSTFELYLVPAATEIKSAQ